MSLYASSKNEHGQNIDVFSKRLAEARLRLSSHRAEPAKLEQPDIPLRVELPHVVLEHVRA